MAVTSHDMRTPLAAVRGYAQLARRHLAGDRQDLESVDRWLGDIDESATRLTSLVSEFMDVTLLRAGQEVPIQLQPTDLVAIVVERVREHEGAAEAHRFTTSLEHESIVGNWDPARIGRVLDNLLGNAVKFSPDGGAIEVKVAGDESRCHRHDHRSRDRYRAAGPEPHLPAHVSRRERQRGGRHRAWPGRLAPAGRADGRRDHRQEPARQGVDLHGAPAACRSDANGGQGSPRPSRPRRPIRARAARRRPPRRPVRPGPAPRSACRRRPAHRRSRWCRPGSAR